LLSRRIIVTDIFRGNFYFHLQGIWSRGSAVGVAIGYGLDDRGVGVRVPVESKIFFSPRRPDRLWGPPSLLSNGTGVSSPVVKLPGREADH
jgi:hypothetical protein